MKANMLPRAFAIVLFILVSIPTVVTRQQLPPSTAPPQQNTFGSGATAVFIDVVVRDEKGRPVTGLREEDFALFEDDVRQKIGAFAEVSQPDRSAVRRASGSVATAEQLIAAAQNPGLTGPQFLAIVFDRLSNEARGIASKGALASLETLREGDFVDVFLADSSLVTVQTYTNDRARIRAAIQDVATRATTRSTVLRQPRTSAIAITVATDCRAMQVHRFRWWPALNSKDVPSMVGLSARERFRQSSRPPTTPGN
jgi:VWFA-related protein